MSAPSPHRSGYRGPMPPQLRLPTMAAMGGMNTAAALIPIAAGTENSRTTNQAKIIRVRQVPINQK